MELLIPGLVLVALMVWASTRIKKNAAAAFDMETVETDEFSIRKPEGFLHVLNDDSGFAFRSYSKEFGKVGNKDVRAATIEIEHHAATGLDMLKARIEENAEQVSSFEPYLDAGERSAWIASTEIRDGGEFSVFRRLVGRQSDMWEARGSILADHQNDMMDKIEAALESVQVK